MIKPRRMRWSKQVSHVEGVRNVHKILVRNPEGKRPLGRSRSKWEDSIKMNVK
jgi:hypothetical protein